MRRFVLSATSLLLAAALAACGSSGSSSGGVRGTELSYFSSAAPFVLSIQTDPSSSAVKDGQALVGRFPLATFGESALITRLQQQGINYQTDIRPLFGNPVMLGAAGETLSGSSSSNYLVVWVTKDAGKLSALISKLHLQRTGSHNGATLYQSGATTFAIDGSTLVFAASPANVNAALDRHAHGGGMSTADASRDLAGLPQNTLVQVFGNLSGLLSTPRTATARRIPWVAALRGYGAAVSASASGISYQYRLDTSRGSLSSSQLPIASGASAPGFAGNFPITVALKDPAQVVGFAEGAEQAASPSGYQRFLQRQASVRAKTGVDLTSLLRLLTGDLIIASDTRTTIGRAGLSDPATASRDLAKLVTQPNSVFSAATSVTKLGGGLYGLKERKRTITVGVVGNQLVVGRAPVAALRAFAAAPTTPAAGAQGSFAFRIALPQLLQIVIKRALPKAAQPILASLGELSGWTAASTTALTGSATLALK